MKNFLKRFGKMVSYTLAYFLITLGTAVGIIFLSPVGNGNKTEEIYIAPQLSHIYQNFTEVDYLQLVDLKIDIETLSSKTTLLLNAEVDLTDGLTDLAVNGVLTVLTNNQFFDIAINYKNSVLFLETLNAKFKIDTNNLGDSINQILSVLNIEIPSLGLDLNSLNPNDILAMLSDLTETKGENNITLNINVPVIGSIKLVCDLNYSIREVSMPKTTISDGTSIAFSSKLAYEDIAVIEPADNDYIEATHLFKVLGATLDYINQDEIGFDLDVKHNNLSLKGNFSANLKDFSAKYHMSLLDNDLNVIAKNNVLYFELGNIYASFALSDIDVINNFLVENFDINLPLNDIVKILESLSNGNLLEVIPNLDLNAGTTDLSTIDLSVIEAFEKVDEMYYLQLRDIGSLQFGVEVNKLTEIAYQGFDIEARLKTTAPTKVALSTTEDNYIQLKKFIPAINALLATSQKPYIYGNGNINIADYNAQFNFQVANSDKLRAHFELTFYDEILKLDLQDETLFLQVKDVKIKADINDVAPIKTFLVESFGVVLPDSSLNELLEELKLIINPNVNPLLVKSLTEINDGLEIKLYNDVSFVLHYNDVINGLSVDFDKVQLNLDLLTSENITIDDVDATEFTPLNEVLTLMSSIKKYIENKKYYFTLDADINYDNTLYHIDGSINYDSSGLTAYAQTTIQNIKIELMFKDGIVYTQLANLKFMFKLSDLDKVTEFINNTLGIDVTNLINELKAKIEDLLNKNSQVDIKTLINSLNLSLSKDELVLTSLDANVTISFVDSMLDKLSVVSKDFKLNARVNSYPSTLDLSGEYCDIALLLPIIDATYNYFTDKQFDISASAKVYDKRTQIYDAQQLSLQLDLTNSMEFYANALITGIKGTKTDGFKMAMNAALQNNYLYVDYNNLLIKLSSQDVKALLELVMNMMGMDTNLIPSLGNFSSNDTFDFNSLIALLPSINMGNALQMLNVIKSIKVENNSLSLILDGSFISSDERAENMSIKLVTDGKTLVSLDITNIYTGVTNEEHFDLHINFNEFNGITKIDTSKNYVNLSGTENVQDGESGLIKLIKSAINTAELQNFEINGTLNINLKVPVIGNINWNIPINAQIKIVDGKPEVMAVIGAIPVVNLLVYNLNDDASFGVTNLPKNRMAYIYYKDEYLYFYRHESAGNKSYERKLKAHIDTVSSDILYYVQLLTGFNDDIIGAIRKSLEIEHDINLGNIIRNFTISEDKNSCSLVLNMQEVTGDDKMGDMGIGLGIVKASNGKDYIGNIKFSMNMPFTNSIQMDMTSNDIAVSNLEQSIAGQELDFTQLYNYINEYPYKENVEWDAKNGEWKQTNERQFTVTFDTGCEQQFNSVTGKLGTEFTLPTMGNREVVTATDKDVYRFDGWYSDSALTKPFTEGIIPRYDITLHAKWTPIEQKRTINFYNGENLIDSQYGDVGVALKIVEVPQFIEVIENDYLYKKEFIGWVDEDGLPITKIPSYSTSLYANYKTYDYLKEYTLSFDTGVGLPLGSIQLFNSYSAEAYLSNYDYSDRVINADGVTTTYKFAGWYLDAAFTREFDFIMPSEDLTIFAKWETTNKVYQHKFIVYDNGEIAFSTLLAEGASISLPNTIKMNENTKWFADASYNNETYLPTTMPNEDVVLHIRNKYDVNYNYYVFENGTHCEKRVNLSLYQGETFALPEQTDYEFDTYKDGHLYRRMYYSFDGYIANGYKFTTFIVPNENINISSNVKEDYKNYYQVSFDTTFVKVDAWNDNDNKFTGKISCKSPATKVDSFYVLDGTTINPSNYNATAVYDYTAAWITKTHTFEVKTWNTSGCNNICAEATGTSNKKYTPLTELIITSNTTLYATWGVK